MWTRGAAVCSLVIAVPACTGDEAAFPRLSLPSPASSPSEPLPVDHSPTNPAPNARRDGGPPRVAPPTNGKDATPPPERDAGETTDAGPVAVDRGLEALSWARLPVLAGGRYRKTSSYDRNEASAFPFIQAGNKDFNNWLAVCGRQPAIGYASVVGGALCAGGLEGYMVAARDDGPGYVSRIFFTHKDADPNAVQDAETIRIFVDDLDVPVYEGKPAAWGKVGGEPFVAPLAGPTSGAIVSYVPISYTKRLRVLLDDLSPSGLYYYHVETHSSAETTPSTLETLASSAEAGARLEQEVIGSARAVFNDGEFVVREGEAAHLLDRTGPGTIGLFRVSLSDASTEALSSLELQVAWDDSPELAVRVPLDALFGQRPRLASFETLAMGARIVGGGAELRLSLPMPYSARARIDLVNTGTTARTLHGHIEGTGAVQAGAGRLHATLSDRRGPMAENETFSVAELHGRGRYIGTVFFLEGKGDATLALPSPLNFLEGDDALSVDGRSVGRGTGTEDFFDAGWYFEHGPFSRPFAALISLSAASQPAGQVTAVRWQAPTEAVDYARSFAFTLEYGAHQPTTAVHYSAVAFSYQSR